MGWSSRDDTSAWGVAAGATHGARAGTTRSPSTAGWYRECQGAGLPTQARGRVLPSERLGASDAAAAEG